MDTHRLTTLFEGERPSIAMTCCSLKSDILGSSSLAVRVDIASPLTD